MTTPQTIRSGEGLRHVQVLALNSDYRPAGSGTTAYEGVTVSGAVSETLEDPEPQQIVHRGDDGVFALAVLPPSEPIAGELTVSKVNDVVDAILTDTIAVTVGETVFFGVGTSNRGDENLVAVLAYQQTQDTDPSSATFGAPRWHSHLYPKTYLIPRESGMEQDTPTQRSYSIKPQFSTTYPWGLEFSTAVEGFCRAQLLRGISEYRPKIVAYAGDGSTKVFALPTASPAASTAKIKVWVDGVLDTPDTLATTQFEWTTGSEPTTGGDIVVFYETTAAVC